MNKDQLKESINSYLKSNDELAYQIDAPWGSGKTYFVMNELIGENSNICDYNPVYISVNGMKKLDDLKKKVSINLLFSISNKIKGVNRKTASMVAMSAFNIIDAGLLPLVPYVGNRYHNLKESLKKSFNLLKSPFDGEGKYKNIVLFIDEFERCTIPLQELMGYLSDMLNIYKCKMIIISNEKEIHEENFFKIKEKLINKSISLSVSSEEVYENIISCNISNIVSESVLNYIKKFNNEVCTILGNINIRTLKSVVSSFNQIADKCVMDDENLLDEAFKMAYTSIFVVTYAMKQGMDISKINNTSLFMMEWGKENKNNDPEINYLSKFNFKNSFYLKYMKFPDSIKELVKNNLINITSYKEFIYKFFYKDTFRDLLIEMSNYRLMDDRKLLIIEKKSKKYYLENDLSIKNKIALYNNLYLFYEIGLLFIKFDFSKLKNDINTSIINTDNDVDGFYNTVNGKYLKQDIVNSIKKRDYNEKIQSVYKYLRNLFKGDKNDKYLMYPVYSEDNLKINNIFKLLLEYNDIDSVLLNNKALIELDEFFKREVKGKSVNNKDSKKFCDMLNEISLKKNDKIFKYNINALQKTINSIVEKSNN